MSRRRSRDEPVMVRALRSYKRQLEDHNDAPAPSELSVSESALAAARAVWTTRWWLLSTMETLQALDVSSPDAGLDESEALARRVALGGNALAERKERSALSIVASHFFNSLTAVLATVFAIAIINSEWIEAVVVVLVILLNSSLGAKQEIESERAMAAIRHMASSKSCTVVRGGAVLDIPVDDLVLGDVVELRQGQQVPADVRLISVARLEVDESILTGESVPVHKTTDALPPLPPGPDGEELDAGVGDRVNMAFRQTAVVLGTGRGVVVAVGSRSEMGKIAERLAEGPTQSKTPLMQSIERLMFLLVFIGILFAVFIFWAFDWDVDAVALLYASATLVAILPEAAVVLITVTMAIGSKRMAARHAIVRKLSALEQLGKVTDICSDKTGTLTQGKMLPAAVYLPVGRAFSVSGGPRSRVSEWFEGTAPSEAGRVDLRAQLAAVEGAEDAMLGALTVCALCSSTLLDVSEHGDRNTLVGGGNPTELALQELVHKASYALFDREGEAEWHGTRVLERVRHAPVSRSGTAAAGMVAAAAADDEKAPPPLGDLGAFLRDEWERRGEYAFDSTSKRMSTGYHHRDRNESLCVTKGAPERVLPACSGLDEAALDRIAAATAEMAGRGLRVLALALRRDLPLRHRELHEYEREEVERDLTFAGLVAVRDPPKPESAPAVLESQQAGIRVRMLTGDHRDTAVAIAREIGILPADVDPAALPAGTVVTGPVLDKMSDAELDAMPELPLVVARSSPQSKVTMVEALHRRGAVVAMTGDGVNDSPAIKEADVGIAMGISGSDVTKSVAEIVLADDNFATIVTAVREGRRIFDSISKFILHLLSGNVAEAVALMISLGFVVDSSDTPVFVLAPVSILWVNTITGSGPAIGLASDPPASDIMQRPPIRHGVFTRELVVDFVFYGLVMGAFTLGGFSLVVWGANDGELGDECNTPDGTECGIVEEARATAFLILNVLLLVHAYNCRHFRLSAFSMPLFENRVLAGSVFFGTLVCIPLIYVPWLNTEVFKHGPISWEWGLAAGVPIAFVALAEAWKWGKRRWLPANVVDADEMAVVAEEKPAPAAGHMPKQGPHGAGEVEMSPIEV